jgi:hypothetical protein
MFKTKTDNIFNTLSKHDTICYLLNFQCKQDCYCDKDKNNNIRRIFFDKNIFSHESNVYLNLLTKNANITTNISIINNHELYYDTSNYINLRLYLTKHHKNLDLLINELFSFVNSFKKYNFIHGNLHIDNILLDITSNKKDNIINNFYIIDLSNSYFIENKKINKCAYKRTSFLEEYDLKSSILKYWDFLSLYTSLKLFFENHKTLINSIEYIETVISTFIGHTKFNLLLEKYNNMIDIQKYNILRSKYKSLNSCL